MTYTRHNTVEEQQEARLKVSQIADICADLNLTLDPVDWQTYGMMAPVSINGIEIAPLMDLRQRGSDSILRCARIKLLERVALDTVKARSGLKATMWSPVEVVQPQAFLSLWAITLETDERIPVIESISDGQRVYEHYHFDRNDMQQLVGLFGPMSKGEYVPGEQITIQDRDRRYTGEVIYVIPPGKAPVSRKYATRGFHSAPGPSSNSEVAARYIVDCNDGFPHIVNQSQITKE
jgi:hypothetical protein